MEASAGALEEANHVGTEEAAQPQLAESTPETVAEPGVAADSAEPSSDIEDTED